MNSVLVLILLSVCTALVRGKGIQLEIGGEFIPDISPYDVAEEDQNWSDCSQSQKYAVLNGLTISPEYPTYGDTVSITVDITLKEEVSDGYVNCSISYWGVNFINKIFELCDIINNYEDYSCPIPSGQVEFSVSERIPYSAPKGQYKGAIMVFDVNNNQLGCIKFKFVLQ